MAPSKKRKLSHDSTQPSRDVTDADWEPQFHVVTRRKPPPGDAYTQYISSYDTSLNLHYRVLLEDDAGASAWDAIKHYKAFQTDSSSQKIKPGDVVAVKGSEEPLKPKEERLGLDADATVTYVWWYAQVLEVRAEDPRHVYLRIVWLYKPEDLRGGRQNHHGVSEVIPSNDMQIINAAAVDSLMFLKKWDKTKQREVSDAEEKQGKLLIWRQTVDVTGGRQKLSPLELHGVAGKAANPDGALIHCTKCDRWLHEDDLEAQALKDYEAGKLEEIESTADKTPPADIAKADSVEPKLQEEAVLSPSKLNGSLVSRFVQSVASPFRSHSQEPPQVIDATRDEETSKEDLACGDDVYEIHGASMPQERPKDAIEHPPPTTSKAMTQATGKLQPVNKKGKKAEAQGFIAIVRKPLADIGKAVEIRQHTYDGQILKVARLRCLFKDCGEILD